MRRGILCLAFLACLSMASPVVGSEEVQPDAILQLTQTSIGLVFASGSWSSTARS